MCGILSVCKRVCVESSATHSAIEIRKGQRKPFFFMAYSVRETENVKDRNKSSCSSSSILITSTLSSVNLTIQVSVYRAMMAGGRL